MCAPRSFHLVRNRAYKRGCMPCFCNGLNVQCESSQAHYAHLEASADDEDDEGTNPQQGFSWLIADKFTHKKHPVSWRSEQGIFFDKFTQEFNETQRTDLYFLVPRAFLGNKLASYGGNLSLVIRYDNDMQSSLSSQPKADIRKLDIRISVASTIGNARNVVKLIHFIFFLFLFFVNNKRVRA